MSVHIMLRVSLNLGSLLTRKLLEIDHECGVSRHALDSAIVCTLVAESVAIWLAGA